MDVLPTVVQSCCGTPYFGAETACMLNMPIKLHMKLDSASTASNIGEHEECAEMVKKSAMPESDSVDTDATPTGKLDQYGEVASYHGDHIVGMGLQQGHTCVKQMVKPEDSLGENAYFPGESSCQTRALAATASGTTDLIGNLNYSPDDLDGHVHGDDETKKVNVIPELELSLTRMDPGYTKHETTEHHTLFHSKASAFSRYDSSKTLEPRDPISATNFAPPKEAANSSNQHSVNPLPDSCSSPGHVSAPAITLVHGQSGQPEAAFPGPHLGFVQIPGGRSESVYPGYGYLYPPVYYMQALYPHWNHKSQHEESHLPESSSVHSASEVNNQEQTFYMNNKSTPNASDKDVLLDDKRWEMARVVKHGSLALDLSSGFTSNVSNDVNCITKEENSSAVSGIARPSESVNDNHLLIRDGQLGKDSSQISRREAALMKFRLKRKERCFEKKVRYQSRKRLAEERPRVKGQFVRQDSSSK